MCATLFDYVFSFAFFRFFLFVRCKFVSHLFWFRSSLLVAVKMCWNLNNCTFRNFNRRYKQNCTCLLRIRWIVWWLTCLNTYTILFSSIRWNKWARYDQFGKRKRALNQLPFHWNLSWFLWFLMWCNNQSTNKMCNWHNLKMEIWFFLLFITFIPSLSFFHFVQVPATICVVATAIFTVWLAKSIVLRKDSIIKRVAFNLKIDHNYDFFFMQDSAPLTSSCALKPSAQRMRFKTCN